MKQLKMTIIGVIIIIVGVTILILNTIFGNTFYNFSSIKHFFIMLIIITGIIIASFFIISISRSIEIIANAILEHYTTRAICPCCNNYCDVSKDKIDTIATCSICGEQFIIKNYNII
jgi:hypothetical protein